MYPYVTHCGTALTSRGQCHQEDTRGVWLHHNTKNEDIKHMNFPLSMCVNQILNWIPSFEIVTVKPGRYLLLPTGLAERELCKFFFFFFFKSWNLFALFSRFPPLV